MQNVAKCAHRDEYITSSSKGSELPGGLQAVWYMTSCSPYFNSSQKDKEVASNSQKCKYTCYSGK